MSCSLNDIGCVYHFPHAWTHFIKGLAWHWFCVPLHSCNMTLMQNSSLKHRSTILGMQSPALCNSGDEQAHSINNESVQQVTLMQCVLLRKTPSSHWRTRIYLVSRKCPQVFQFYHVHISFFFYCSQKCLFPGMSSCFFLKVASRPPELLHAEVAVINSCCLYSYFYSCTVHDATVPHLKAKSSSTNLKTHKHASGAVWTRVWFSSNKKKLQTS